MYLSADSPNTITQLEKGKVYIIGGLVDRNAHKGLCLRKATVRSSVAFRRVFEEWRWRVISFLKTRSVDIGPSY